MAPKKDAVKTARLVHANGTSVIVDASKVERLVAGGNFTAEPAKRSTSDK